MHPTLKITWYWSLATLRSIRWDQNLISCPQHSEDDTTTQSKRGYSEHSNWWLDQPARPGLWGCAGPLSCGHRSLILPSLSTSDLSLLQYSLECRACTLRRSSYTYIPPVLRIPSKGWLSLDVCGDPSQGRPLWDSDDGKSWPVRDRVRALPGSNPCSTTY